ncbi:MAG: hypothetical protein N2036_07410 [Bryobacteraceae bacterium]|nr:hypothetical protein [Bryobacteraceae bacterium]
MQAILAALLALALSGILLADSRPAALVLRVQAACELDSIATSASPPNKADGWLELAGNTTFRYRIRTSREAGQGVVWMQFDASPGSTLRYRTSASGAGSPHSAESSRGDQRVPILSFGANDHSPAAGSTAVVEWHLRLPEPGGPSPAPQPTLRVECR